MIIGGIYLVQKKPTNPNQITLYGNIDIRQSALAFNSNGRVTELKVQDAFNTLMQGRTSFVVAHRLSTIRHADCILVMKDGKVAEQGTHEELLAKNGFYTKLYNSQFAQ